jgi:hypothetical protein
MKKYSTFAQWYEANRYSVLLNDEYSDYKHDAKTYGDGTYITFKAWMKEKYESLHNVLSYE